MPKSKAAPKPAAIKELLSQLITAKKARDKLSAQLAVFTTSMSTLEDQILERFTAEEIASVRIVGGLATKVVDVVPQVEDWDVLYAFIKKHNAFELLQKRVTAGAWKERLEAKQVVPGVISFNRVYLKLTLTK